MKKFAFIALTLILASTAAIAAPKTYQVTGIVNEVTDSAIIMTKGKERWELQRDAASQVPANLKAGSKVTVEYTMTAKTVTSKDGEIKDKK